MEKVYYLVLTFFLPTISLAQWQVQTINETISYRSMDTDKKGCIWAGGSQNTISYSCDWGKSWSSQKVGTDFKLDFRGICVLSENEIIAMSAGMGNEGAAKIYKSIDKGLSWTLVYTNSSDQVFMDGIKFFNSKEGIVYGDPINGKLFMLKTEDGGESWNSISANLPDIKTGEASYAASNTNIAIWKKEIWVATQGRIFFSKDKGRKWGVMDTPFESKKTAGIFGLYLNNRIGIAVGGDYVDDKAIYPNVAFKDSKLKDWGDFKMSLPSGLKEAVLPITKNDFLIIGTSGTSAISLKDNRYDAVDTESFHTGVCDKLNCYAIGTKGRVGVWAK